MQVPNFREEGRECVYADCAEEDTASSANSRPVDGSIILPSLKRTQSRDLLSQFPQYRNDTL